MYGMHEAAIVRRIIDIAEKEAREAGSLQILLIKLKVGEFRGVATEALEFAFAVMKSGTMASAARLEMETIPLRLDCRECRESRFGISDLSFTCSGCGGPMIITAGRELEIEYLEMD
jgi:hydrogenase nickel incorporation protein HypA/HybF